MSKQTRINILSVANVAALRKEKRNGKDVVIVPSVTLPDNVVMNDIKYPAEEIAKSYATLNRTPAPHGHPMVNGQFVSASDPEGINIGYIGAWNENVRQVDGRVFLDKVIDVEVANRTDDGKQVMEAINAGGPIHTSTGLLCELEPALNKDDHKFVARNMIFDHDAILINEEGAATPEQGVGMLVNGNKIEVLNSSIDWADRDLDWAVESAITALEKKQRAPALERFKTLIEALWLSEGQPQANEEKDLDMSEKELKELANKVDTLSEGIGKIGETVANAMTEALKPVTDSMTAMAANAAAAEKAELDGYVEKIVKANLLTEEGAKGLTLNAAKELAEKANPGKATGIFNGTDTDTSGDDEWKGYNMNSVIDEAEKNKGAH